jgi:hypothetical protein
MERAALAQAAPALGPRSAREAELEQELYTVTARLSHLPKGWPALAILGAVVGFTMAPSLLLGAMLLPFTGLVSALIPWAYGLMALGVVGLAVGIGSAVWGSQVSSDAEHERTDLETRGAQLRGELDALRRPAAPRPASPPGVTLPAPALLVATLTF